MEARPYTELSFEDKYKINGILDKEELSHLEKYIKSLEEDNISLQEEVDDLEYRCGELEDEIEFPLKDWLESVIYNRYMQTHKDYKTLDELLDAIEHQLRYL